MGAQIEGARTYGEKFHIFVSQFTDVAYAKPLFKFTMINSVNR